jgi:alpha-1,3-mannosyltransferase
MSTAAVMPLPLPDFLLSSAAGRLLTDLFAKSLSSFTTVTLLLLACELVLNALIVKKVPYTEIDWQAYVDEVEGVIVRLSLGMLDHPSASPHPSLPRTSCSSQQPICRRWNQVYGNFNYTELRGPTGPLVYPAGFVYTYSVLHWATDAGTNIARAQAIFIALYLATFAVVAGIYAKAAPKGFHPCWLGLLCLSKRIHSIFALRLFNDGPTMLFLYLAVLLFLHKRWTLGCTLFSFAFGNKMNIILFSPALFILLVAETGPVGAVWRISLCGAIQVRIMGSFGFVAQPLPAQTCKQHPPQ